MDTKDLLKKVRKIEIKTRRLSDHIFSGEYHTSFKGRGMTFSEVRQYQYGDDIRAIDWNVTARYNEAHVKVFEEERELTMMLMVDISGSESFGSKTQFKKDIVTEIAATMAFSATQNNDKIGLILFAFLRGCLTLRRQVDLEKARYQCAALSLSHYAFRLWSTKQNNLYSFVACAEREDCLDAVAQLSTRNCDFPFNGFATSSSGC